VLLNALCIFKAVRNLLNFLQTAITARGLTESKVTTPLVDYKVILL